MWHEVVFNMKTKCLTNYDYLSLYQIIVRVFCSSILTLTPTFTRIGHEEVEQVHRDAVIVRGGGDNCWGWEPPDWTHLAGHQAQGGAHGQEQAAQQHQVWEHVHGVCQQCQGDSYVQEDGCWEKSKVINCSMHLPTLVTLQVWAVHWIEIWVLCCSILGTRTLKKAASAEKKRDINLSILGQIVAWPK